MDLCWCKLDIQDTSVAINSIRAPHSRPSLDSVIAELKEMLLCTASLRWARQCQSCKLIWSRWLQSDQRVVLRQRGGERTSRRLSLRGSNPFRPTGKVEAPKMSLVQHHQAVLVPHKLVLPEDVSRIVFMQSCSAMSCGLDCMLLGGKVPESAGPLLMTLYQRLRFDALLQQTPSIAA